MVAKNRNRKTHRSLIECKFDTTRQRLLSIDTRSPDVEIAPNYTDFGDHSYEQQETF
jgi:hypothetical protein